MTQLSALSSKNKKLRLTWLFTKSELTEQYFPEFQQKIVLEMSNTIIPISSEDQLVQIIQQLQIASRRANPFKYQKISNRNQTPRLHKDILHAVLKLPLPGRNYCPVTILLSLTVQVWGRRNQDSCSVSLIPSRRFPAVLGMNSPLSWGPVLAREWKTSLTEKLSIRNYSSDFRVRLYS